MKPLKPVKAVPLTESIIVNRLQEAWWSGSDAFTMHLNKNDDKMVLEVDFTKIAKIILTPLPRRNRK